MIGKLITWAKNNKLAAFLLLVVLFLLIIKPVFYSLLGIRSLSMSRSQTGSSGGGEFGALGNLGAPINNPSMSGIMPDIYQTEQDYAPQAGVTDRMVIEESHLSLLVKNVVNVRKQIISQAQSLGGYMVSSQVSSPEEAPYGTVVVRVPSDKLEQTLDFLRGLAVKVVSENLTGQDVTDQYVDYDKRIAILEATKAKFEQFLTQAQEISDITNLNREIISIQNQIDSLKGQQEGLSKRAQLAKLTIYLSTDEIALPYAPSEAFRPNVIFKLAVRSLVGNLRQLAEYVIWIGVYAVIWVPILLGVWWYRKSRQNTTIKK